MVVSMVACGQAHVDSHSVTSITNRCHTEQSQFSGRLCGCARVLCVLLACAVLALAVSKLDKQNVWIWHMPACDGCVSFDRFRVSQKPKKQLKAKASSDSAALWSFGALEQFYEAQVCNLRYFARFVRSTPMAMFS
jgi:hypothetical protein